MRFIFVSVWIAVLNLNCFQASAGKEYGMELEENKGSVILIGEVKQENGSVVVSYELKNQSNNPVLAWDFMPGFANGEEAIDDSLAYVCYEEPSIMRVVRAVLPLPPDRDIYQKEIPYARTVEPSSSATGKIVLPVPLEEYNPYYIDPEPKAGSGLSENEKEVSITKIRLLIGWTEIRRGMIITDVEIGGKKVKMIRGAWDGPLQQIAEADFSVNVKGLERTDRFDRRLPQR